MNAFQLWELKSTRPLPALIEVWREIYLLMQPRRSMRFVLPWMRQRSESHLNARQTFARLRAASRATHKISHDFCYPRAQAKRRIWEAP
jgi:hypothetical protein